MSALDAVGDGLVVAKRNLIKIKRVPDLLVFTTSDYGYLGDEVCRRGNFPSGSVEVSRFPDGERYQRILQPVDGRDVALIGGTISDEATLELYDLASAIVKYGARSLTLVIPFFGHSTMERAVKPGEVVTAKTRARLLSSIPAAGAGNVVLLVDLHPTRCAAPAAAVTTLA